MTGEFFISRAEVDGVPTLSVRGDVDFATSPLLYRQLKDAVEEGHPTVALDLSGVRFFDSAGARALLDAVRGERESEANLRLTGASRRVQRVFHVLRSRGAQPSMATL